MSDGKLERWQKLLDTDAGGAPLLEGYDEAGELCHWALYDHPGKVRADKNCRHFNSHGRAIVTDVELHSVSYGQPPANN